MCVCACVCVLGRLLLMYRITVSKLRCMRSFSLIKSNIVEITGRIIKDMNFNPFSPEFLKCAHPSLNLDTSIVSNWVLVKN